jgi:hypothetical protein
VTPAGGSISSNGIVLADNLFPHCIQGDPCASGVPVTAAPMTYSATVTLPTTSCTNCTLQLVQFMSYHPVDPSFFYHHCAAVTIVGTDSGASGGGNTGTAGSTGTGVGIGGSDATVTTGRAPPADAGTPKGPSSSGCSIFAWGGVSGGAACIGGLGVAALFAQRRRERARSTRRGR